MAIAATEDMRDERGTDPGKKRTSVAGPLILGAIVVALFLSYVGKGKGCGGALCNARQAAAKAMIEQLTTAAKKYETDHGHYPPGDGTGSRELARYLSRPGPKQLEYFWFSRDMLIDGDILNPVWPESGSPQDIIYYRNNVDSPQAVGPGQPPVYNRASVDLWAAGCSYHASDPSSAWQVNNWE